MSVAAQGSHHLIDDALARRNAIVLAVAQAMAGANNTVLIATGSIAGAMLAPDKTLATLPITDLRDRHVARHAAGGCAGAPLRPPHRVPDRNRLRCADRADLLRRGALRLVRAVQCRRILLRALCGRASGLSLCRRRYRERCVPAEGDLLGADRRRGRGHRRPAGRDRDQGYVAALSVRGHLSRAGGDRGDRRLRADAAENSDAARAAPRPNAGRPLVGDRAAAEIHRRRGLRHRQLFDDEHGDDGSAARHDRMQPYRHRCRARSAMACARDVRAELLHRHADRALRRRTRDRARICDPAGERGDQHLRHHALAFLARASCCSGSAGISPSSAPPRW